MSRVLIVDDREENLYLLRALLEGNHFKVLEAHHGAEALAVAREDRPDVVVSDLLMPVMDGYTLLRHWKADTGLSSIPFVVYTATYTQEEDEELARNLGADGFMVKPAEPDEILKRIQAALARSGGEPAPANRPKPGVVDEEAPGLFREYSQVLVRKLEEKMLQLEQANRALEQDLEVRRRAKEELEENAGLLRMAGRAAQVGAWAYRVPDRSLVWSEETFTIHGLPPGRVPTLEEGLALYIPEHREALQELMRVCMEDGTPFDDEFQMVTGAQRRIWVRAIGEAVWDAGGSVVRIQGAIQDISHRKIMEQQFLRTQRMESIATLTGGMAHDLNNVLAPILLSIQLLKEELAGDEALTILGTIESCAQRGREMVRQVLSFARGIEGTQVRVDTTRLLDDLTRLVQDTFPGTLTLTTLIPRDLWALEGDPTQLHQVVMNLLLNARDAMPDGGRLVVAAENVVVDELYAAMVGTARRGDAVRISVSDTGTGISPDDIDRIFEPLFTTKPQGTGTGLGLSTAAAIVRNHRGTIQVDSEPGVGTTFLVQFPALSDRGAAAAPNPPPEVWQGSGELILVVDDEAAVRSITKQTLEAFGYRVVTATDGADCIAVYGRQGDQIALVITDLGMPVMDGAATIEALRRLNPSVRIIAASGSGVDGAMRRARAAGVRQVLAKPYTAATLLAAIKEGLAG